MSRDSSVAKETAARERLLNTLAEQIKLPLLQIARQAELARLSGDPLDYLSSIELTADTALKLLDNYSLSLLLSRGQELPILEPVSIGAVLNDTAHKLQAIASQYQCGLELHMSGKYEPILANRAALEAALTSLGYVFIEAQSARAGKHQPIVKLAAHRGKQGIVAGMFAEGDGLSSDIYRRSRQLYGRVRQPLTGLTATSGAGVFIADSLLGAMSAHLRVAHHQKLAGLAATFKPSYQLELLAQ